MGRLEGNKKKVFIFKIIKHELIQLKYGMEYSSGDEENCRRAIFEENLIKIEKHNADFKAGKQSFDMIANHFADLTQEEFIKAFTGNLPKKLVFNPELQNSTLTFQPSSDLGNDTEDEVDWRKKGAITPVENQGRFLVKFIV